jgi:hypothetical protein
MSADDERERFLASLDATVARHYARDAEGLPPPCEPHPGYATLTVAWLGNRRWLEEHYPLGAPTPVALPDPPASKE